MTSLPVTPLKRPKFRRVWIILVVLLAAGSGVIAYQWRQTSTARFLAGRCHELSEQSNWEELEATARRWAKLEPQVADPWLSLAEAAEAKKDWQTVADCLGHIPRNDERAVPSLARKSVIEFENLNRPWEGLKTCDQLLEINPLVLMAHKQSVFFCAMTLQRSEMVRRIRRAIRLRRESPESYVFLVSASWFYGSSLYRHNTHWLKADPDNETFQVAQAMQIYMSEAKTNLEEAAQYEHIPPVEEMLRKYPHNSELLAYLLDRAMEEGEVERAKELYAAVPVKATMDDARFCRARGWLALVEGDLQTSKDAYLRAFSIDPYWWKLHHQLMDVFRRLGQREQAEAFLRIYEVSLRVHHKIIELNRSSESFGDAYFREPLLQLAELVGDTEVVDALRERLARR